MNTEIMLSVCVVTYNHYEYIEQALDSILAQKTNFPVEVIVADDASPDGTAELVEKKYGDKVRLIKREKNVGLSRNLYECMTAANGKYIYTHAGDDWLKLNDMFQRHVDFLEAHSEYSAVSHWTDIVNEEGNVEGLIKNTNLTYSLDDFLMGKHLDCQDSVIRNYWKNDNNNDFLWKCGRNNEENAFRLYFLEKGMQYNVQESLACYRYVCREDADNYNSTHSLLDVFKDNYHSILYLETIRGNIYDLRFMKFRLIYEFFGAAVKRDKSVKKLCQIYNMLTKEDKKLLKKNVGMLLWHKGKFPEDYMKKIIYKSGE